MAKNQITRRQLAGFTLVELLISMVVGLILASGLFTVFSANLKSYDFSKSLSYMQSNSQFVIDTLQRDIRMAGYQGCSDHFLSPMNVIATSAPTNDYQSTRVLALQVDGSAWSSSIPGGYTPPVGTGAPITGTDALLLQFASSEQGMLANNMSSSTRMDIIDDGQLALRSGELAVIGNCSTANLFTVASTSSSMGTTTINSAEPFPINFSAEELDGTSVVANASGTGSTSATSVHRFHSKLYYVGDSGRTNKTNDMVRALFVQSWPYQASNPPVELIEGVEQFQIGVSMQGDSTYLSPGASGFDPRQSSSISFGILMASIERLSQEENTRAFRLGDIEVNYSGSAGVDPNSPVYTTGNRVHRAFSNIVKLRNTANAS